MNDPELYIPGGEGPIRDAAYWQNRLESEGWVEAAQVWRGSLLAAARRETEPQKQDAP
jgi:hypothetical protein